MLNRKYGEASKNWGGVGEGFKPSVAGNTHPLGKVAVFGHSYVARLNESCPKVVDGRLLKLFWLGGATTFIIQFSHAFDRLVQYQPELTILLIGGNDIKPETQPRQLAAAIEQLAQRIEERTGGHCLILGIEKRSNPRGMSAEQFHKVRNAVNRNLRQKLVFARDRYHPMEMSTEQLTYDGVHLNQVGTEHLFEVILQMVQDYYKTH